MRKAFSSDVAFIGTYLPERGPFLAELLRRGVPISIWGDRWNRAPEWNVLKVHWRGPGLDEAGYAAAVQSSKLCLGLLSKEVGDTCTTRSIEIPALGGLLCAERTSEHLALYRENEEAVFWADAEECSTICLELLADAPLREAIARSGRQRALRNGRFNETAIAEILTSATSCVQVESTFSASRAWRRRSG
jgi:spore maturation protein CgeB